MIGLLADQRPGRPPHVAASLIGRPATFSHGIAHLHWTTGAPVWFAALLDDDDNDAREIESGLREAPHPDSPRDGEPRLRLHLEQLVSRDSSVTNAHGQPGGQVDYSPIRSYARAVSDAILRSPTQYFWWHRRWKGESDEFDSELDVA